ncbi:MAG TPA: response regulator [Candidatus Saccharimonadales bacterium]|nr:response regulator [Candidatus Saccharimonadales bacterium]
MTKILLVEDDKSLREIYGVRLLAEGYDIVSAGDGEEALAMAIKEHPQLIVSDVMMPKISGFDMLDILRSTTETKGIKVIMMTALSSEDQRARGEALGADRYLVKSQVGIEDVVRTVHEVLEDAPVAAPSAAQTFNTPAPSALPRTAPAPAVPPRSSAPDPTPQPAAPQQQAAPTPAPSFTSSSAAPAPGGLPQPTAPFSTPRPTNLGDRIIHPVSSQEKPDLGSLMDQELNQTADAPSMPASVPPQPTTPPQPSSQPTAPTATPAPQPTAPSAQPVPSELHGASDINFDDTPQPAANNPLDSSAEQPPRV